MQRTHLHTLYVYGRRRSENFESKLLEALPPSKLTSNSIIDYGVMLLYLIILIALFSTNLKAMVYISLRPELKTTSPTLVEPLEMLLKSYFDSYLGSTTRTSTL